MGKCPRAASSQARCAQIEGCTNRDDVRAETIEVAWEGEVRLVIVFELTKSFEHPLLFFSSYDSSVVQALAASVQLLENPIAEVH